MGEFNRPGMRLVASTEVTGGLLEIIEDTRAAGQGPPAHVHREHLESFYVLEGRFSFTVGAETVPALPGDFITVPRATPHAYRAEADASRVLIIVAPAGLAEFLNEQDRLIASGMSVREAFAALAGRFDSHLVD